MQRPKETLPGLVAALALLLACHLASAAHDNRSVGDYKVCPSMEIRNAPEALLKLRNCTVIEGRLTILLVERSNYKSFENLSFPELREVTGYIKIYRVRGLRNLGDLFPNLSVIRGITQFKDYALVIYDNGHLQSLGLRSLTRIEKGSVRIERNDKLCYVNTIEWSKIIADGTENSIFRNNYDPRLCGLCPNSESLQLQCPRDSSGRMLCWDDTHCQNVCPVHCENACMRNGTCCHDSCLGGCDGPTQHQCHVCKRYSLYDGRVRTCVSKCPLGTYMFSRRCISELECRSMTPPQDGTQTSKHYKTFNNSCIYTCPSGYMEEGSPQNSTCAPCAPEGCSRECAGGTIDSVVAAEKFHGCTHVKGSIEIMLRAGSVNTMGDLESHLGEIREIEGYLKIVRSHSLVSLSFLKSLRRIVGTESITNVKKQSLHIFNNPNLELLWNWTKHGSIEILNGKLFIHFNPKLCYNYILPLKNMTRDKISSFDELEVSEENNGDQASCYQETLQLQVSMFSRNAVILTWNAFCLEDIRKLLGYSIYYIMAQQNVTQYERRDACYDSWNVLDMTIDEVQNVSKVNKNSKKDILKSVCSDMQPLFHPLTQLEPYTRYAAYVKTYTTLQDKRGAQSPIIYFKTLPGKPSPIYNLGVEAQTHALHVRWSPPARPNGRLTRYYLELRANQYNRPEILQLNYCQNPSAFANLINIRKDDSTEKKKNNAHPDKDDTCSCRDNSPAGTKSRFSSQVQVSIESIDFENALQNEVYVKTGTSRPRNKNSSPLRTRRSIDNSLVILSNYTPPSAHANITNGTDSDGYVNSMYMEVPYDNNEPVLVVLRGLRHYTWYTVSVWACRAKHDNETAADFNATWCSDRVYEISRTTELGTTDVVKNVRAEMIASNKTTPEVNVTWDPPANPNGFVVAYDIHHVRVEANSQSSDVGLHSCMSASDYEWSGRGFLLRNLAAGNYSIRVTPVTVRGSGNTSHEIFVFIPERGASLGYGWAWGVAAGCAGMAALVAAGVWYARRGLLSPAEANKLFASVNPEYVSTVYVPDEWEVPRANVELVRELGQGSFGMVYEGIARDLIKGQSESRCAVKTVNEHATDRERIEFLNEASVMKAFDTFHVVRLLGVVSRGQPTLVVMELMEGGDLKSYLRSHRPDADSSLPKDSPSRQPPTLQQIQQMAIEIADGMAYLSAKKFVHRDLAARNCMVAGDLTVKVGDFGMTRDIYETDYYRKGSKGLLPVRWMSPESLKDGVFSSNSDVWSFGVVLWEMATLAMQPYQGLSNEQVLRYVVEGGVMERPEHCPDRLYELMRACWAHRASSRPSFLQLVAELLPSAAPYFRHRSFFNTPHGQELYAHQRLPADEEGSVRDVNVGAVATGSGSNLFGVSGRLASWVRELSSLRSRTSDDAAAEPLAPDRALPLKPANGLLPDAGC